LKDEKQINVQDTEFSGDWCSVVGFLASSPWLFAFSPLLLDKAKPKAYSQQSNNPTTHLPTLSSSHPLTIIFFPISPTTFPKFRIQN
jgi:hypothetical protein